MHMSSSQPPSSGRICGCKASAVAQLQWHSVLLDWAEPRAATVYHCLSPPIPSIVESVRRAGSEANYQSKNNAACWPLRP